MTKPMDHIAYLSQEIGPRPAGTEEEQQAALYITDKLQKDAHLSANIEDFTCSPDPTMPKLICYGVALVATILAIILPALSIPAFILTLAAAVLYLLEAFDRPVISRLFMKGVSQNVVAKYEPTQPSENTSARRRKIIVVANYDSGKVRKDLEGPFLAFQKPLQMASLAALAAIPFVLLLRSFMSGAPMVFFTIISVILAVALLIPTMFAALEKTAAYNEAANDNAAGIAVMLEIARRLGTGEASGNADAFQGVMHDEETAYAAGVVPEGASLSYEYEEENPQLSAAAIEEAAADMPLGTLAEAAAHAAALASAAEEAEREAAMRAEIAASKAAIEEEERRVEEAALVEAAARAAAAARTVPDWYRKATQKAHAKADRPADLIPEAASYRSRFADFPTPDEDEVIEDVVEEISFEGDIPGDAQPEPVIEEAPLKDVPAEDFPVEDIQVVESDEVAEAAEPVEFVEAVESVEVAEAPEAIEETEVAEDAQPVEAVEVAEAVVETDIMAQLEAADPEDLAGYAQVDPSVEELFAEPQLEPELIEEEAPAQVEEQVEEIAQPEAEIEAEVEIPAEAQDETPVVAEPEIDPATAAAATTRLPQMMYYKPPAERPEVMQARAQKNRVTVDTTEEEAAVLAAGAVAEPAPMSAAAPVVQEPEQFEVAERVITPNIPVVELPEITLPPLTAPELAPISFDDLRQRAPLATAAEADGQTAAKELLVSTLPPIAPASFDDDLFGDIQAEAPQNTSVSMTGSFAAVSAIGAEPVGDELVADVAPEDMYVDDADDTVFEENFTDTGAFAGPGYVEMPQSRFGKFFSKFRKKKNKEEESASAWLGVDDDFDARSVGKARGGWESFRDDDEWEGGAFSSLKARMMREDAEEEAEESARPSRNRASQYAVSASAMEDVAAMAAALSGNKAPEEEAKPAEMDEIRQIYSFAAGDINTEVWFVALGSELANNAGIKAFLAAHESEMRGAVLVNLEALGAGDLCYLEREGYLKQMTCSARMKRFIRKASQASGIDVHTAQVDWKESAASYALKHRMQAMTLVGMDGSKPAGFGEADDVVENIDEEMIGRSADLVVEVLRNI